MSAGAVGERDEGRMKEGARLIGIDNEDMVEFLQYIRQRGGECYCSNYELKIVEVIRGTVDERKIATNNIDGVLGRVDVGDNDSGEGE